MDAPQNGGEDVGPDSGQNGSHDVDTVVLLVRDHDACHTELYSADTMTFRKMSVSDPVAVVRVILYANMSVSDGNELSENKRHSLHLTK